MVTDAFHYAGPIIGRPHVTVNRPSLSQCLRRPLGTRPLDSSVRYWVWIGHDGLVWMGMKATLEINDELFARAKRHAEETGRPLCALVEEGLRRVLSANTEGMQYRCPA